MRLNKDGTPDKRFKNKSPKIEDQKTDVDAKKELEEPLMEHHIDLTEDPNELHQKLLRENKLKLDFSVISGTVETKEGFIKLTEPTLVVRAEYVNES